MKTRRLAGSASLRADEAAHARRQLREPVALELPPQDRREVFPARASLFLRKYVALNAAVRTAS